MSDNSSLNSEELESIRSYDSYEQPNATNNKPIVINNLHSNAVSDGITSTGLNEEDYENKSYIPNTLYF